MTYAKELKKRLKKHGLTQKKLSDEIGVSNATMSQYVNGVWNVPEQKKLLIDSYFYMLECVKDEKSKNKNVPNIAEKEDQSIKHDKGKPQLSLVPAQIIYDIAQVREYGLEKYGGSESWKDVDPKRYIDALYRHLLAVVEDPHSKDEESGIEHYKHVACNVSFLCELLKGEKEDG